MFIAGRQLPPLPPVLDAAAIQLVIQQIGHGSIEDRIFAAHQYASLLEAEENKYRALVGDPHASPNLRSHYTIGKLLNAIKDEEEIYDTVVDSWISSRSASLEQNVAGLRLLLACLDCWLFQYPLTEESLVEKLGHWAVGGLDKGAVLGDAPPETFQQLLEEARRTYALGLLGIALANEEYADEAVQTPLVAAACSYLQRTVMQNSTAGASTGQAVNPCSQQQVASHHHQQQQQQLPDSSQSLPPLLLAAAQQQPEGFEDDVTQLRLKMLLGVIRCLTCTGEYVEALAPFLTHQGVECCCILLRAWQHNGVLLNEVLQNVCSLLAHRRFGELLVEQGGVQLLLDLPRTSHTNMGLSLALFGLASLPLAFERTCALPAPIPQDLVAAGLGLLAASSDAARKNAALFFDSAVHHPVMLEAFDAADGLHRLLYPLRHVVQLLQAGDPAQLRSEKQVAYHASRALLQYIRAHLVLHISALQRRLRDSQGAAATAPQPHKPITTSAAVVEELTAALTTDAKLAEAFVRNRWPLLDRLAEQRLVALILELVRVIPGEERYFSDICLYCLEVLQLISLSPFPRRDIIASISISSSTGSRAGGHQLRSGMAVLLHAASTGNATPFYGLADPEIIATALQVISNCVTAPASLAYLLPAPGTAATVAVTAADKPLEAHQTPVAADLATAPDHAAPPALELGPSAMGSQQGWQSLGEALEAGYAAARQAVRGSNGIRVLLTLLQSRQHLAPAAADKIRALACSTMLGLARDSSIRHILAKLQVGKLLAELVREPTAPAAAGGVGSSRREVNTGAEEAATAVTAGGAWQERFHRAALELIATTTSSGSSAGRAEQRLAAAAATDAAAPALLKIERAAIAAATPITYPPQELLLLMYEHLKASGLHSSAAALAKEAGLAGSRAHTHGAATQQQQQQHNSAPGALAGSLSPAAAGATPAAGAAALSGLPTSAFAAAAITPVPGSSKGIHVVGGSSSISSVDLSSRERRRMLSLGPGLMSQLNRDTTPELDDKQQQQQQQQQQQGDGSMKQQQKQQKGVPNRAGSTPAALPTATAAINGNTPATAAAGGQGLMSPPAPLQLTGTKRKAAAAAAAVSIAAASNNSTAAPAGSPGFDTPGPKRQALGQPSAATAAAAVDGGSGNTAAAAAAAPAVLPLSPVAVAVTPAHSNISKRGGSSSSTGTFRTPGPTAAGSDAEYLLNLAHQQQQQAAELFHHTQNLPATPYIHQVQNQASDTVRPAGNAAAVVNTPHLGFNSTPSPGSGSGFNGLPEGLPAGAFGTIGAGGGTTPGLPASPAGQLAAAAEGYRQPGSSSSKVNPLLSNLPSRQSGKSGAGLQRRLSGGTDMPHKMTPIAEAVAEPKPLPLHVQVAARDVTGPPVNSRLSSIVTAFLRHQHRAACLTSAQPVSVVPPISLLKNYTLPTATRAMQAPINVTLRRGRQELFGGFGGRGGAAATRRFIWSRFRLTQTLRDDGPLLTACAFFRGYDLLVSGTSSGELKLHDAYTGDNIELIDAHTAPVNLLQASPWLGGTAGDQLLLSSSRSEVLLWRADSFDTGPLYTWSGLTRGRFNPTGSQVVGVAVGGSPRQARVYDTTTGEVLATLDEAAAAAAATGNGGGAGATTTSAGATAGEFVRGAASACFSPSGELVLWGATIWDPRVPAPLHTFDQLSGAGAGGCFHPGGAEIILNSEVWDLRNRKLLRSVPTLDGTSITFNSSGDVLCAWLRRPADDSMAALLQPKRRRHALATSFISMDARSYTEIGNVQVERAVLDLCLDPSDSYVAAVAVDIGGGLEGSVSSSVRLYEVGRQRPAAGDDDEESDGAGEESEEDEEENEEELDFVNGNGLQALLGADADIDDDGVEPGSDAEGAEGDEGEVFGLEDGMTLEDALDDMYESALAAGFDPEELGIGLSGDEGDDDGLDEDDMLDGESSEYETDEEGILE